MNTEYDHIIAIDYAERNTAIARLTKRSKMAKVIEGNYSPKDIQIYLKSLSGRKLLTIEETTTAQWLYCELRDYVDRIIICDPYRNRLLSHGPKNDKIDASKLALLARSDMLHEVYHTTDTLVHLRKLVSGYQDIVLSVVRFKNRKSAVYRNTGLSYRKDEGIPEAHSSFVLERLDRLIVEIEKIKEEYVGKFNKLRRGDKRLRCLSEVPGIGIIGAVKILAIVINAHRFEKGGKYLSYCGLVKHRKDSGGKLYGYRKPRFNRQLKSVYKTAALTAIGGNNDIRDYYQYLLKKGLAEHNARHAMSRHIAKATYGMLKNGTKYKAYKWRESIEKDQK